MNKEELEASLKCLDVMLITFGILVAIGVTGESIVGWMHWRTSGQLQKLQTKENLKLQKEVAEANERTLRLWAEIQPRYLTEEQKEAIGNDLRNFAGRKLLIASQWIDAEAAHLAREIKAALNRASVGIGDNFIDRIGAYPEIPGSLFGGGGFSGSNVHVGVEVWGADRAAVEATARALRSVGKLRLVTTPQSSPFAEFGPVPIAILVGVKPIPEPR